MHRILMVCDGKEIIFTTEYTSRELAEFIRAVLTSRYEQWVYIKDDTTNSEMFFNPNKVSFIKDITPGKREAVFDIDKNKYLGDIVLPLENTMGLDKLTEGIVNKVSAIKELGITIILDNKEVGRVVSNQLRKMQMQENITLNLV